MYFVKNGEDSWGTFVDERIRYKTLFEPGSDLHDDLDEIIVPLDGALLGENRGVVAHFFPG